MHLLHGHGITLWKAFDETNKHVSADFLIGGLSAIYEVPKGPDGVKLI